MYAPDCSLESWKVSKIIELGLSKIILLGVGGLGKAALFSVIPNDDEDDKDEMMILMMMVVIIMMRMMMMSKITELGLSKITLLGVGGLGEAALLDTIDDDNENKDDDDDGDENDDTDNDGDDDGDDNYNDDDRIRLYSIGSIPDFK
jgi:hypothetical protein